MPSVMNEQSPDFDIKETAFSIGIGVTQKIAPADADRWAIMFAIQTNQVLIGISGANLVGSSGGFTLSSGNSPLILSYRDVGPLVGCEWYVRSSAGTATVTVWTISKPR